MIQMVQTFELTHYNFIGENNQSMITQKNLYFAYYCAAFIVYGSMITAMGPIIPYFSQITGEPQPFYSFLFFARAFGYVAGGSLVKILMERFTLHQILTGATIVGGFCFMFSTFSITFWNLLITLFFGGLCCCVINVTCNVCVMQLFRKEGQDFWIQLLHLMFGVGGFVGPTIAAYTGANCYFYLGILLMLVSPIFIFKESPEDRRSHHVSEMAKTIDRKVEIMICVIYLLYIGQEVGFGSWVSSYAVMEGIASAKQAAYASSLFWTTNTVFRIVLIYVTVRVSLRLKVLMTGMILGCIVSLFAALSSHQWFAAYVGSFLNGAFLSSLFALFLALPLEFGYKLSKKNTANFMMCASLGEGALAMPIGYAMGLFGAWILFFLELTFAVLSLLIVLKIINIFEQEEKSSYLTPQEHEIVPSSNLYDLEPQD